MSINILLTGGRAPVTLHLARLFKDQGVLVYVAESENLHLCQVSNAVTQSFLVPKPNDDHAGYIQALCRIIKEKEIALLIPTCEEIFHIARGKETIERTGCRVFCEDIHKLWKLHNKWEFNKLVGQIWAWAPQTHCFTSSAELKEFLAKTREKVVVKPVYSRFGSEVHFFEVGDRVPQLPVSQEKLWIVQRFIKGTQYCSYSVASRGKLLAHSVYSTKYTAGPGATVFFQHVEQPDILQFVTAVIENEDFTGQIAFDFIQDQQGKFYPIECNPRSTSGIHLFNDNRDFALTFLQESDKMISPSRDQAYMLGIPMLLYCVMGGSFRKIGTYMKDFHKAKDVIFSWKDWKPFFFQIPIFFHLLGKSMKYKKDLTAVTTMDIEWGENL